MNKTILAYLMIFGYEYLANLIALSLIWVFFYPFHITLAFHYILLAVLAIAMVTTSYQMREIKKLIKQKQLL